jgi:hypothetical protein
MSRAKHWESYAKHKWGDEAPKFYPTETERSVVDRAVNAASVVSGMSQGCIVGRSKVPEICDVRFIVYHITKQEAPYCSMSKLGRLFGRDHGTILNGLRKVRSRQEGNETAFREFRKLHARIKRKYDEYENNPERMVQELGLHDGRQGDDLPPKA